MAKLLQTLIPILFLLLADAATTAWSQFLYFGYNFSNHSPTTALTLQGEAKIVELPDGSGCVLRLTEAENEAVGRVLYSHSLQFWQTSGQIGFVTAFSFTIRPSQDRTPADGIVFFIAPVGTTPPNGGAGGNLGVFESSGNGPSVFAVEFDTFVNEWDPNYRHIGVDIGSRNSSNTTFVGDAIVGQEVIATILYGPTSKVISVEVSAGTEKFEVSYEYDLRDLLPQQVQVGLSAATGGEVAIHDIHAWSFASLMMNTGAAPNRNWKQLLRQFV